MRFQRTSDLVEAFISDCRYRNLADKVISEYKRLLSDIEERHGDLMSVDRQKVKEYVLERLNEGLSPYTVNHYIKAMKVFYSFLIREDVVDDNPMAKLIKIREPKRIKPVLDENKVSKLISTIPVKGLFNVRDKAMITLLWDTAIRLSELLTIELANLNMQFKTIKILGKGNKERIVPFGNKTKREILKYLKYRNEIESQFLFCTKGGMLISTRNFQRTVRRLGQKIGVKVSPHLLRHSAATFLAKHEMPAQHIQILLGHSSLSTTQRYINQIVNQEGLQISHRRLSPADRL
ncbi:MAG: tyrosine-type recombinase/integrase [candidate division Zixibacteria bacterium]|nr:tyrosine-type recombinase/integrase [candidate division Zixibacteria bacterium]